MTARGEILYLERDNESQIKIRGARLELKEIDAVLGMAPGRRTVHSASLLIKDDAQSKIVTFVSE